MLPNRNFHIQMAIKINRQWPVCLPVVTTNAGGLSEINIQGETGYMGEVGDVKTMGKQALIILEDPEVLKQFKERAAAHARKYDIQHIVPIYEKLYERFL